MTPTQQARRTAIFADLTEGRELSIAELLTHPDTTDYDDAKQQAEYLARRGERMLITDSRFSDCWYRILAHLAADTVCKRRIRNDHALVGASEESLEEWEAYVADLIWTAEAGREYVEAAYASSCGFPLF